MSTKQQIDDRYQIGDEIGYGGMSEVYLAIDTRLKREVAVKILKPELASDRVFYLRFEREARNAAALSHPNIVQVYDTGETQLDNIHVPFIVMEYIDGETFREILTRENYVDPATAMHWIAEVCDALHYSHLNNIVHRDIKPANIIIDFSGAVKVMDFGIARAITDISRDLTQTSTVIGTARYLSPEQATGQSVDARSDIYSLGCVFFELLTGRTPFTADTPVAVAYQHVKEQPPLPSSFNSRLSPEIDSVVLKSLNKNPNNRYQSAAEFRDDILTVLSGNKPSAPLIMTEEEHNEVNTSALNSKLILNQKIPIKSDDTTRKQLIKKITSVAIVFFLMLGAAFGTKIVLGNLGSELFQSLSGKQLTVPNDIIGKDLSTEVSVLIQQGFKVEVEKLENSTNCTEDQILGTEPVPGSVVPIYSTLTLSACGKPGSARVVPVVINDTLATARKKLVGFHLTLASEYNDTIRKGHIIKTDPPGNSKVDSSSKIIIFLSLGPEPHPLPYMIGRQLGITRYILQSLGISVTVNTASNLAPKNQIVASSSSPGIDAKYVPSITLTVSTGSAAMPNLVGVDIESAKAQLVALGYKGTITEADPSGFDAWGHSKGQVTSTDPSAGTDLTSTTPITLAWRKD